MAKPWFNIGYGARLQPVTWQGYLCVAMLVAGLTGWSIAFFGVAFGLTPTGVQKVVWIAGLVAMVIIYEIVTRRKSRSRDD